jgi:hypothetical protein
MKENMTEVELNQELQKLADQLPIEARLLIFELMLVTALQVRFEIILSRISDAYLDVLSTLIPRRRDMSQPNKKH